MKKFPCIQVANEVPLEFTNSMSPMQWIAALTKAYNEIAPMIYDFSYDSTTSNLTIKEREG